MKKTIFTTLLLLNSIFSFSQSDKIILDYPETLNEKDVLIKWTKLDKFFNQNIFLIFKNVKTNEVISKTEITKLDLFIVRNLVESAEYEYWIQQSSSPISQPIHFTFLSNLSKIKSFNDVQQAYIANFHDYRIYEETLCTGTNTTLYGKVFPANNTNLTFQWLKNGNEIIGQTNETLLTSGIGIYSLKIYQNGNLFTSVNSVNITYSSSIQHYIRKNEPSFQCTGKIANLNASYYTQTATYQWTKNGANIAGATNKSYVASETGIYKLTIQDNACAFDNYYSEARLYFDNVLFPQTYKFDSLYCNGGTSVQITALNASPDYYNFQWLKNGAVIPSANNYYYEATDEGIYSVKMSQSNCSSVSEGTKITKITEYPKSVTIYNHTDVCLANSVSIGFGFPYLNYQWYKDGMVLNGQNNQKLSISQSGVYKCLISSYGLCPTISDDVVVTNGSNLNPQIVFQNVKKDCGSLYLQYKGDSFNGQVDLTNLAFQWLKEGVDIINANNNLYYATESGSYQLRVTNTLTNCSGLSNILIPEISSVPEMSITRDFTGSSACKNTYISLNLNKWRVIGQTTYQWKKNGVSIPNENFASLFIKEPGNYSVVFTSGNCVGESTPVSVKIDSLPTVALSGNSNLLLNQYATLPLTLTGGADYAFTLNDNVTHYLNASATSIQKQPITNTTYSISAFGNHCGVGIFSGSHVVNILSCPPINTINNTLSTTITLKASERIIGQNLIQTGSNVRYSAKKSVIMSPPFKTEDGSIFQADTEGCNN